VKIELPEGFDDAKGGRLGDLDVVNECIDRNNGKRWDLETALSLLQVKKTNLRYQL
jgi:hypothetical protein